MILDNIIPMSKELFKGFLGAACVLLCGQLHADWSDFLDEVGKKGNEWSEKGKEWGKEAVDSAVNQWDNLDFNYDLMQMFGGDVDEQSALVGRFYDLKQPVAEGAKPLTRTAVVQKIREFDEKEWDQSVFDAYYSPAVRLYAPYFYLPRCKASYGPEAFQCNGQEGSRKVAPSGWVVVYRGIVTAPEDGFFRFAGMGDDTLMVRFDNKLVLEAGWSIPTQGDMVLGTKRSYQEELTSNKNKRAFYSYKQTPHWNKVLGGIPTGEVFKVKKGKKYDDGESWRDRFRHIFRPSIEKLSAFVGVEDVVEETVDALGFNITIDNASGKTYALLAKPYRVTADVPYLRRKHDDGTNGRIDYNNELNDPKLSILSTSDNMFTITVRKYNPETGRYDLPPEKGMKMYFKNSYTADSNKDDYTQQVTLPDNGVYGRSNSSSATWSYVSNIQAYITVDDENIGINIPVIGPRDEGNITGREMKGEIDAAKTLNSKQLEIIFRKESLMEVYTKEFIEEYVLFYLKQIIPSTTIFKIKYEPMDTVYGITINNR